MAEDQQGALKTNIIEELERSVQKLKAKCEFLESIVNEVPGNIYISDLEKGVVWCNKINEESLGYSLEEILKMGTMEYMNKVIHPMDLSIPEESIEHYKKFEGPEFGGLFRARHKNEDEYKWYIGWSKAFERNQTGEVKKIICVDVPISQQMNTEKQLTEALKESLRIKNKILISNLRKREVEILNLVCQGLQTRAIAERLFISTNTVSTHRKNIQKKLGTTTLAELVSLAREAGLG